MFRKKEFWSIINNKLKKNNKNVFYKKRFFCIVKIKKIIEEWKENIIKKKEFQTDIITKSAIIDFSLTLDRNDSIVNNIYT